MEGVKILCHQMKMRPLSSPVIELSQNTGLLLDKTLIHIPESDTPPPLEYNSINQVPSNQVPLNQTAIQSFSSDTADNLNLKKNASFPVQDSMIPFELLEENEQGFHKKSLSQLHDSQHKTSKKMKKEIHHTTATGTLPLRKINKRDATELDFKNAPKAPRSAYQIFLYHRKNELTEEQGRPIKITNEIVRQIGTEWSSLPKKSQLKQTFENKAEEDKQRYLRELADFLRSEPYLDFLKGKTDGQPVDSIDDYLIREQETLNCLICNQIFSTSHNKKEHLLGRGHLLKLMNGFDKFQAERNGVRPKPCENDDPSNTENENACGNLIPFTSVSRSNEITTEIGLQGTSYTCSSLKDNLHTDSSNATTEDYSWNSPSRTTLTPDASSNNFSFQLNQINSKSQTTSMPSELSPSVTHSKDALLGSILPYDHTSQTPTFPNQNATFEMSLENERSDFDMTKLDLPDDFNISHDYLNDLQSCKLDQISPSLSSQLHEAANGSLQIKQEPCINSREDIKLEPAILQGHGAMDSIKAESQFSQLPTITIPSNFKISNTYDLLNEDLNEILSCFIEKQKSRNDLLKREREANSFLQRTQTSLKAEIGKLSQSQEKLEKDNMNLKEYGHSLEMQLQNLKNLPTMIVSSRNYVSSMMNGYKSPQSDSLHGDVTSSPSTYCESSITSPMPPGNGLMSPLTPSGHHSLNVVHNHNVFNTFNNGMNDSTQNHSIYGTLNRGNINSHNIVSPLPFQGTNILNSQWSAN